jgi:hypothetical protein
MKTLIQKINEANKLEDILDVNNFDEEYKSVLRSIHPDVCVAPGATAATAKLNELRDKFRQGVKYVDDSGEFKSNGYFIKYEGDKSLLKKSFDNFTLLKSLKDKSSLNFHRYMPNSMNLSDGKIEIKLSPRAIPLVNRSLPQEHVNWILSRMLEYSAWLAQVGFVHCGINPASVFIVPETHGIQVCSFYHMTRIDRPVSTVSARYKTWYPPQLFSTKQATSNIDLELAMKTAIYLLGDKSGSGIKLRKTHHEKFMNFVIKQHYNAHKTFLEYRELLQDNFKKEFHPLNI